MDASITTADTGTAADLARPLAIPLVSVPFTLRSAGPVAMLGTQHGGQLSSLLVPPPRATGIGVQVVGGP